ncbi:MAG: acyltransferase family protein [Methylocella sp.]|nr:MAG: acyltransferase [Hyphomicrobiales bacterium]
MASVEKENYTGIQALRFLAAILVVMVHATMYTKDRLDPTFGIWFPGRDGVDVFFVISGFVMVVSSRKLMTQPDGWLVFAKRRLIRIVPLYWLATTLRLGAMLAVPSLLLHPKLSFYQVVTSYLFFPARDAEGSLHPLLVVGWTLNYEMFFYMVFTLALLLRRDIYGFIGVVLGLCALGSLVPNIESDALAFYFNPIVIEFFGGMLLARVAATWRIPWWACLAAFAVGLALLLAQSSSEPSPRFIKIGLPALLVVSGVVFGERWLAGRIPIFLLDLGAASYALYLFHPIFAPAVPTVLKLVGLHEGWISIVAFVMFSIIVSVIAFAGVERRMTRSLNRRLL